MLVVDTRPRVVVQSDQIFGWRALVLAPPGKVDSLQGQADQIVRALRAIYELADKK